MTIIQKALTRQVHNVVGSVNAAGDYQTVT